MRVQIALKHKARLSRERLGFHETIESCPDRLAIDAALGYTDFFITIWIDSPEESINRVAMQASRGFQYAPVKNVLASFEDPARKNVGTIWAIWWAIWRHSISASFAC